MVRDPSGGLRPKVACDLVPPGGNRAVVILVPDAVAEFADRFRRRYDAEWFERVPPHVSLLGPFAPVEPDDKTLFALTRLAETAGPLEVELTSPDAFLVPELFLFLRVADEDALHRLHNRVLGALPNYLPAHSFHPHLTVGRFAAERNLSSALAELGVAVAELGDRRMMRFRVDEIHLFGEDPRTGVFRSVAPVALRGGED